MPNILKYSTTLLLVNFFFRSSGFKDYPRISKITHCQDILRSRDLILANVEKNGTEKCVLQLPSEFIS